MYDMCRVIGKEVILIVSYEFVTITICIGIGIKSYATSQTFLNSVIAIVYSYISFTTILKFTTTLNIYIYIYIYISSLPSFLTLMHTLSKSFSLFLMSHSASKSASSTLTSFFSGALSGSSSSSNKSNKLLIDADLRTYLTAVEGLALTMQTFVNSIESSCKQTNWSEGTEEGDTGVGGGAGAGGGGGGVVLAVGRAFLSVCARTLYDQLETYATVQKSAHSILKRSHLVDILDR